MAAREHAVWRIEANGIEPIPAGERSASLRDVFWIWFGANIAILGVVLGAVAMSYGLSLWQGVLATLLGAFSFALVGVLGVSGMRLGVPTLTLARATFGIYGNLLPTAVAWLNLIGWEVIVLVTATYALAGIATAAFGVAPAAPLLVAAFAIVLAVAFLAALLGYAAIARLQAVFSHVFGLLTLVVFALLVRHADWGRLLAIRPAPLVTGFLPAMSVVVAGTGLSWVTAAADYTRYLPQTTRPRGVIGAVTWGALLPVFALMLLGVLLSATMPALDTAANPIAMIGAALPAWMAVPYLLTAVGGLVTEVVLAVYSSGLSLLAAGIRIPRYRTILVDAGLSIVGGLYFLFAAPDFQEPFVSFLTLLAAVLAPWAGVVWVDSARRLRMGYSLRDLYNGRRSTYGTVRWRSLGAFAGGCVTALLLTSSPLYDGPLAKGVFQGSSLGFLVGMGVSIVLAAALREPGEVHARPGTAKPGTGRRREL